MNGLMLHCGAYNVPYSEVVAVKTPPASDTHHPISHVALIESVKSVLANSDLRIASEAHAITHVGDRYFGLYDVEADGKASKEQGWVLGLRNSHDASFAAGMVAGSRVFVCDNLSFSGEVRFGRKHTRFIERDLPSLISAAVGKLATLWRSHEERAVAYKAFSLEDRDAHDLIIRSVDVGAISPSQLLPVLREWRKPSHVEFADRTAWSLFNAITEVQKTSALWKKVRQGLGIHGLLDAACGLDIVKGHTDIEAKVEYLDTEEFLEVAL